MEYYKYRNNTKKFWKNRLQVKMREINDMKGNNTRDIQKSRKAYRNLETHKETSDDRVPGQLQKQVHHDGNL